MNTKFYTIAIAIAAIAIAGMFLLENFTGFFALSGSQSPKETVVVGAILPLTGAQASYGQGISEGLLLALDEINGNPEHGFRMKLVLEDNGSEVKNSVTAAQKLIGNDRVDVMVSGVSQHSVAIAPIAQENSVVLLTMASQATALNNAGDFVFKNDDEFARLGREFAPIVFSRGHKKAGIIFAQYNDATLELKDAFGKKFESLGGQIVAEEGFDKGETDFRTRIAKIKDEKATAVLLAILVADASPILKQLKETGFEGEIFANPGVEDNSVLQAAGNAAEGVVFATFNGFPSAEFSEKIEARFGHKPLRWSAEAYDGLKMVAEAISRIEKEEISSETIRQELGKMRSYTGEAGTVAFDEQGNAKRELYIKEIKDGEFVPFE